MQFNLKAQMVVSAYTVVEAETLEEAIDIASQRSVASMPSFYASAKHVWLFDNDGEPQNIEEEV